VEVLVKRSIAQVARTVVEMFGLVAMATELEMLIVVLLAELVLQVQLLVPV
jgi:hypothetical protein